MDNKAMYKLSYGLFVLTSAFEGKDNGCIINTGIQVTSEPNRISIAVNKSNFTQEMVRKSGRFNLSVLSEAAGFDIFRHFVFQSGRDVDKFAGYQDCRRGANGLYIITAGTNACISATVEQTRNDGVQNERYLRRERFIGSCRRSFYVGDKVKQEDIHAKFEDGILRLFIPKVSQAAQIEQKNLIAIEG